MSDEIPSPSRSDEAPGARPGMLVVAPDAAESRIRVLVRREGSLAEQRVASIRDLDEVLPASDLTWIDVTGLANTELLEGLAELLGLHPLALEDIGSTTQRPKIESYGEDLLIFARMLKIPRAVEAPNETQQLSIFLRRGLVVTFREQAGGEFAPALRTVIAHALEPFRTDTFEAIDTVLVGNAAGGDMIAPVEALRKRTGISPGGGEQFRPVRRRHPLWSRVEYRLRSHAGVEQLMCK